MTRCEIMEAMKNLANTQSFYARMYDTLVNLKEESKEEYDKYMNLLESKDFKNAADLALYFQH